MVVAVARSNTIYRYWLTSTSQISVSIINDCNYISSFRSLLLSHTIPFSANAWILLHVILPSDTDLIPQPIMMCRLFTHQTDYSANVVSFWMCVSRALSPIYIKICICMCVRAHVDISMPSTHLMLIFCVFLFMLLAFAVVVNSMFLLWYCNLVAPLDSLVQNQCQ